MESEIDKYVEEEAARREAEWNTPEYQARITASLAKRKKEREEFDRLLAEQESCGLTNEEDDDDE